MSLVYALCLTTGVTSVPNHGTNQAADAGASQIKRSPVYFAETSQIIAQKAADNGTKPLDGKINKVVYPICRPTQCGDDTTVTEQTATKFPRSLNGRMNRLSKRTLYEEFYSQNFARDYCWKPTTGNVWLYRENNQTYGMYKFREDKFDTGEMPGIPPEVVDVIENKVSRKDDAVMADMVACSGPLADKSKTTFPFGVFRVMTAPILHQVLESLNIEGRWARPPFILRQYMTLNNLERYYELDWSMEQYCIRAVRKLLNDVNSNAFGTDTRIGYLRAIYLGFWGTDGTLPWKYMTRGEAMWVYALMDHKRPQYDAIIDAFVRLVEKISELEMKLNGWGSTQWPSMPGRFRHTAITYHDLASASLRDCISNPSGQWLPENSTTSMSDVAMTLRLRPDGPMRLPSVLNNSTFAR